MLEVADVTKSFGGLVAVEDVDLRIDEGEIVGLIGPNGAGKTTLFNVISGLFAPDSGSVVFNGTDLLGLDRHEICRIGLVRTFQEVRSFNHLSVLDNVAAGAVFGRDEGMSRSEAEEAAHEYLSFVGLEEYVDEQVLNLTIANRKQVELARGLATDPELLMIDEMGSGLNPTEIAELSRTIEAIRDELGVTVFWIEHVMEAIMNSTERVIVLYDGRVLTEGRPDEIKRDDRVIEAYLGAEV